MKGATQSLEIKNYLYPDRLFLHKYLLPVIKFIHGGLVVCTLVCATGVQVLARDTVSCL